MGQHGPRSESGVQTSARRAPEEKPRRHAGLLTCGECVPSRPCHSLQEGGRGFEGNAVGRDNEACRQRGTERRPGKSALGPGGDRPLPSPQRRLLAFPRQPPWWPGPGWARKRLLQGSPGVPQSMSWDPTWLSCSKAWALTPLIQPTPQGTRTRPPLRVGRGLGGWTSTPALLPTSSKALSLLQGPGLLTPLLATPRPDPHPGWLSLTTLVSSSISTVAPDDLPLMLVFTCEGHWWAARPEVLPRGTLSQCRPAPCVSLLSQTLFGGCADLPGWLPVTRTAQYRAPHPPADPAPLLSRQTHSGAQLPAQTSWGQPVPDKTEPPPAR